MNRRPIAVTAVAVALLGACSSGDTDPAGADPDAAEAVVESELVIPEGDEPEVLGPIGETNVEFETEDGVVQIGEASVPEAVASSFPVPDDLVVQISSESGDNSGFSGVSELGFDELRTFFEEQLPIAGYEWSESRLVDGVLLVYEFDGPDGSGEVVVSSAPSGGRSVLVTFTS